MPDATDQNHELDPEPQGAEFIDDLIDTVADGNRPKPGLLVAVNRFLNNHQAKIDLTQLGLVKYHMSRVQKMTKLIDRLEEVLMPEGGESVLETGEAMELLKTFTRELHLSTEFIANRASKPVVSSPDGMRGGIDEDSTPAAKNSMLALSPERRNRIRQLTAAVQSILARKRET